MELGRCARWFTLSSSGLLEGLCSNPFLSPFENKWTCLVLFSTSWSAEAYASGYVLKVLPWGCAVPGFHSSLGSRCHPCFTALFDGIHGVTVTVIPRSCSVNSELFKIQSSRMEWLRWFGERGFLWGLDLQTFTCVRRLRELKQHSSGMRKEWGRRGNTTVSSGYRKMHAYTCPS